MLSYRLAQSRWQLWLRQPVSLHIDEVVSPIPLRELDTGLKGFYPFDDAHPLTLTHVRLNTLGGKVRLTPRRLPQHAPAVLKVEGVEMSELITALNPKQFALSWRVSGELPLLLDDPTQVIPRGWLASDNLMTLRLDPQFADALSQRDIATAAAAVDWLRYMEISNLRAGLHLSRAGDLTLNADIAGTGAHASARRTVRLHYTHRENIWQLWRSLRFGERVEQLLEKQAAAAMPAEEEP
ncbi:YdbH domain-containing protein [Candidatus Sodalis endolongispinus]|uniref:YdbH domain-containing protein n=1 Tax=Candidatus Sodalis endolongispinus TaxID=2812662 RepID=A0ABS5YE46_9GAMM|nr:YdbH domain-containing protein [Candidatus Sodalis endolongispinus]MBT9433203.1 YdbH domain-containing protein [Candidatus Sodalis endolongispinus]